ncbi:hypothetical protein GCM10022286_05880 [Gryllotalpicola daejeonensis]|uniref:Uncharacterized protein n=1 Tax=Gryllotalpicola daejeonensis TaxID=993087 RepID=A0ABP7ZIJ4_9MICO
MPISRFLGRIHRRLTLFSGWTWIAAGSLIGFEALELVFGTFVLVPELLPLVILCLALAWYFRRHIRRLWSHARARRRLASIHRRLRRR